jgi:3-deoxy-7-phosphoheptulonate synthase
VSDKIHTNAKLDRGWQRDSECERWRACHASQQPKYEDRNQVLYVTNYLRNAQGLVEINAIRCLKNCLEKCETRKAFLLHVGDCAEKFAYANKINVLKRLRLIYQLAELIEHKLNLPVIKIGRIAGQYAKPRSHDYETRNGITLPIYRGDIINDPEFTRSARRHSVARLLTAYHKAKKTIDLINSFLSHKSQEFFVSHEALLLEYESALTRRELETNMFYNQGAHFLWIGERTRQLNGAHIVYASQVSNPVGVKLGPSAQPGELISLLNAINPYNESGKIVLITRFGAGQAKAALPPLIKAVVRAQLNVQWACDPMHGNTVVSATGLKTRDIAKIIQEITETLEIHKQMDSWLAGLSLEATSDYVTECVGGQLGPSELELGFHYETACDPRLNYLQALEVVSATADRMAPTGALPMKRRRSNECRDHIIDRCIDRFPS